MKNDVEYGDSTVSAICMNVIFLGDLRNIFVDVTRLFIYFKVLQFSCHFENTLPLIYKYLFMKSWKQVQNVCLSLTRISL